MRTSLIGGTLALLLGGTAACLRPDHAESWPGQFFLSAGPLPGFAIKRVIERVPPAMLVADDGSVCRTSRGRFANTKEDRWIACNWALPALDSTETAAGPGASEGQRTALKG